MKRQSLLRMLEAYRDGEPCQGPWWEKERERVAELWRHEQEAFPKLVVGTDEVGRGPMAGPLVTAAACSKQSIFVPGLNDSKQLGPAERELVCELVLASPIRVVVEIISVEEVSAGNLHHLSLGGMRRALQHLKVKPGLVLVDGKYPLPDLKVPQKALIKGDRQSALIAAASIVAKVTRDRIMVDLANKFPGYGWEQNVGYPTEEHREALRRLGPTPHHRRNYRPVRQVMPTQLLLEPPH